MPFFFAPREARTTLPCPDCGANLNIRRSCHEAYMYCPACQSPLNFRPLFPAWTKVWNCFLNSCMLTEYDHSGFPINEFLPQESECPCLFLIRLSACIA